MIALLVDKSLACLLAAAFWLIAGAALAQDNAALIDKLERLERDIRTMERAVYGGKAKRPAPARPAPGGGDITVGGGRLADAEIRLSKAEDQMRSLTGKVEEAVHRMAVLEKQYQKFTKDLDLRLRDIETKLGGGEVPAARAETGKVAPGAGRQGPKKADKVASRAPAPLVKLPDGSPQDKYNFAMNLIRTSRYVEAEGAFRAFLKDHGDDRLAGNAKYWLAETYYVRQIFDAAARTYLEGYQKYPRSTKAPDMLLKLAKTLTIMGQTTEACATLGELSDRFPNMSAALRTKARSERKTAGCG